MRYAQISYDFYGHTPYHLIQSTIIGWGLIASLTSAVVVFDYEGINTDSIKVNYWVQAHQKHHFGIALAPADKRFIRIARDAVAYADALRSLVRILDTAETCRAKADIDAIGDEKARKLLAKKVLDLSDKSVHYEIRYHLPVSRLEACQHY
ncbi:MAG: hypothetical protein IPJ55_13255 [Chloracidobacterium sp.]|nr:hypothetical protein [Chloracidobacterium sp.]